MLTASNLNTHVRDNLLETAPAKVTTAGDVVVATGPNAIARAGRGTIVQGIAMPFHVVKSADESVTGSTSLQNDDHLVFAVGANEIWVAEYFLTLISASVTPDFKLDFSVPSGAVGGFAFTRRDTASGLTEETAGNFGSPLDMGIDAANTYWPMYVYLYIDTAGTAGNVQLRWAQNTSNANAMTMKAGSMLRATRTA